MTNYRLLMNPYKILELDPDCNKYEIKRAYKKMSLKFHPDRNNDPTAPEHFNECTKAYEILIDDDLKNAYDNGGWQLAMLYKEKREQNLARASKCPLFHINKEVTLENIFNREHIEISESIPIYDQQGKEISTKKYTHSFRLTSKMAQLDTLYIECQGIEQPDHVTGDIAIHIHIIDADPNLTPEGTGELTYNITLSIAEIFGFNRTFTHPNGQTYTVSDKFNHPDPDGTQRYVIPNLGMDKDSVLLIVVNIDYNTINNLSPDTCNKLRTMIDPSLEPYHENINNLLTNSITVREYETSKAQQMYPPQCLQS